jgi:hypothetical protein
MADDPMIALTAETKRLLDETAPPDENTCSHCGAEFDPDGSCYACFGKPSSETARAYVGQDGSRGGPLDTWEPHLEDEEEDDPPDEPSQLDRLRAALVDAAGLDHIPDPVPLIGEDIIFRDSLVWLVGKPGSMKSLVALDMAGCVGTGEPWHGWPVAQGVVLFLVAEGVRGTKRRVRAWEKAQSCYMENVYFLPLAVQSRHGGQWAAFVQLAAELNPALIVIDTQARVTVGVNENDAGEMGEFVQQAERLRGACGACVIIVHHIGRNGETGRGSSTLDGAVSTVVKATKDERTVKLECLKSKDSDEWDDIRLRAVPMGESIVLALDDGSHTPDSALAARKWVQEWWAVHAGEPVSISVLVKSGVVTEATFHRSKRDLLAQGIAAKEGKGNGTRYRLAIDPTLG